MIAHLRGELISKSPNRAVVQCAGVGYDVAIPVTVFSRLPDLGAPVSLHIYTHVREDQLALYGFLSAEEKLLFERLISVSGVGPKAAVNILSGLPAREAVAAIRGGDHAALTRVPGVGRKTAERLVLELHDKLDKFGVEARPAQPVSALDEDVLSALLNLGYQRAASDRALAKAKIQLPGEVAFEKLFRCALEILSR